MAAIRRALASDPAKTTDAGEADRRLRELDERLDRAEAALIRPTGSTDEDDPVQAGLYTLQQLEDEYEQRTAGAPPTTQAQDHGPEEPEADDATPFEQADRAVQQVQEQVSDLSEQLRSWSDQRQVEPEPEPDELRSKREQRQAEADAKREPETDRHARTKKRLARLALVLVATTIVSPMLQSVMPGRAFAVASDSMAPTIPRGSLAIAAPGELDVGDVVVYQSVLGSNQIHRIQSVQQGDGTTYYTTRGDANDAPDAFSVPEEDVIGVVQAHVPYLGYLWMMSLEVQAGLFLALVGTYLGVTFSDDRVLLKAGVKKVAAVALVLAVLIPAGHGMVDVVGSTSTTTAGANQDPPLPFYAGDEGSANVSDSRTRAAAGVGPPTVWKERSMWGCEPKDLGDCVLNQAGDETWEPYNESYLRVDASQYAPGATFVLEAVMDATNVDDVNVRLVNASTGQVVPDSTVVTSASSPTRVRSPALTLTGDHQYRFEVRVDDAANDLDEGLVHMVKLVSAQPGADDTVTTVPISGADHVTGDMSTISRRTAIWQYNASATDGSVNVHFEAVADLTGSCVSVCNADVQLVRASDGVQVAELTYDFTAEIERKRTADISGSLSPGEAYKVEIEGKDTGHDMLMYQARIVIEQDTLDRTIRYVDLSWRDTTTSTSFVDAGYPAVHNGSMEPDPVRGYFEATMHSNTAGETVTARLTDATGGGAVVDGSTISATTTSATRVRTAGQVTLNRSDTVYRAEIKSSASTATAQIRNAWIISYQDAGRTWDHVLENAHNVTGTGTWKVHLDATGSTNLSRVENMTVGIRVGGTVDVTAKLPTARYGTAAVWDPVRDVAYVFGGIDAPTNDQIDEIVAYDPATGEATVVATLPTNRSATSAVWDPNEELAYVFGGVGEAGNEIQDIVAYDPVNDTAWNRSTLPTSRASTSAVWDPDRGRAYMFGGDDGGGNQVSDIVAYEPANNSAWVTDQLPSARDRTSAVWDAVRDVAYVFGGMDGSNDPVDDIVEYDPTSGTAKTLEPTLPTPRSDTTAVWDPVAEVVHILGGANASRSFDEVVEFDPAAMGVGNTSDTLPSPRKDASAVWDPGRDGAYVVGGADSGAIDDIARYSPHGTLQIQVDDGTLNETPTSLLLEPGRTLQHVVHAAVNSSARSEVVAELVATHRGTGLTFRQPVEYVLYGKHGAGAGGGSGGGGGGGPQIG